MNAAFVPSGDVTALFAAPPRPPRPAASASAVDGTPGQFDRAASHTTRDFFAGSTRMKSALPAPVRYHMRPSGSQVAETLPPVTRLPTAGASSRTALS